MSVERLSLVIGTAWRLHNPFRSDAVEHCDEMCYTTCVMPKGIISVA